MPTEIRICPHCGASVSGSTDQCPRCDGWLDSPSRESKPIPDVPVALDEEEAEVLLLRAGTLAAPSEIGKSVAPLRRDDLLETSMALEAGEQASAADGPAPGTVEILDEDIQSTSEMAASTDGEQDPTESPLLPDENESESDPNAPTYILPISHEESAEGRLQVDEAAIADDAQERGPEPPTDEFEARREATPTNQRQPMPEDSGSIALPESPVDQFIRESTPPHFQAEKTESAGASFENAKTAPLPITTTGQTPFPRPATPVPEPEPLPAMDTQPKMPAITIPPAPFTPPPLPSPPVAHVYAATTPPSSYWLQQRIQAYLFGNYRLQQQKPNEVVLSYGKPLSYFWWIVGMASGVGILWYFFILLLSGFRRDLVYVILEPDGYVYEEGPGAAHIRRRRSRVARRWAVIGLVLAVVSVFTILLVILAASALTNRYPNELNAAYPEFGLINTTMDPDDLDATRVQNVKVAVLVFIILLALAFIGTAGGIAMSIIGYLHSAAFRVDVAPLPDHR